MTKSATKIKRIQLIDDMNLLVLLNFKNEIIVVDLLSNKVIQKLQVALADC